MVNRYPSPVHARIEMVNRYPSPVHGTRIEASVLIVRGAKRDAVLTDCAKIDA